MQTTKRMLALLMCLVMLFTAVPVEAFATGEASSDGTVVTEPVPDTTEAPSDSAEVTEAPTEVTEAPVEPTEAPTEVTEATEEVTEPPVEETEAPSEPSDEELMIMAAAEGNVVMVEHNGETTYYATLQKAFDGFAPSNNTYGGKYVVTLLGDVSGNLNKVLSYPTEVLDITLDLNGHTITGDGTTVAVVFNLGSGQAKGSVITITDSVGTGKITGGKGGVKLDGKDCTLRFEGGNITGNHGASKGGGIFMGATAKLVMTGGAIYGNSVTGSGNGGWGGGVLANYADILGGAIYGNTANGSTGNSGRGGGVCTEITRTKGYSTLTIASGVVFGNTATNAGDDVMAQGNGMSGAKFSLSIGTENWYIDGWNGTKATAGKTDRYSAENPVAYTDGGFNDSYKNTVGLKYVVPSTEPEAPAAPYDNGGSDTNVADFIQFVDANGHGALLMNITGGFTAGEVVWNEELGTWTCDLSFDAAALLAAYNESYAGHRYADEIGETITVTHKWFCGEGAELSTTKGQWVPNVDGNIYKVNVTCKAIYTVTYTDGVEDEEIFADQTYTVEEGEPTPAYSAPTEPTREGYTFAGWTPEVAETVTESVTYTAQWKKIPVYVARLESTGEQFETLQAALDAAKAALSGDLEADKITMIGDTTECVKLAWTRTLGNMALTIDLNGHTVTGNGTNSVMTFSGLTSGTGRFAIVIEDSSADKTGTITGGVATSGGAIKMDGAKGGDSLTINGGNFTGNTATSSGGALYCAVVGATVTVNGGTFTGNTAASGGAISAHTLVINGGTFVKNTANGEAKFTGRGGAIQVWYSGAVSLDINGGTIYGNTASRYGDDIVFCSTNSATASMNLVELNGMKWYVDGYYGAQASEANLSDRFSQENAVEFTDYDFSGKGIAVALKAAEKVLPAAPELPKDNGSNVTDQLITIVCDTVDGHAAKTYGWGDPAANFVFPKDSEPFWNEEIGAWTIGVRIDSIGAYYVGLQFNKEYNGIQHETVDGLNTIDTTLVWDAENNIWQTLTGEPFVVHVTCQDVPEAPQMGYHLGKFQIKVVGVVDGEEKVWHESLHAETVTVGEVKGDRESGFTVDVTVTLAEGDSYFNAWLAKHAPDAEEGDYLYDWSKTDNTVTFTMKYTGDTTGELYDGPEYWGVEGDCVYTAYVMEGAPDAPTKFGENVTPALIRVICDSDPNHAPMDIKWQHQSTEVRTWESGVVWSEEHNAWIVPIRIDSISVYYVWLNYEKANNDIIHDLVPDMPLPEGKDYIDTYLKWDAEQDLWVTLDGNPIEIHTTCKTAPTAPAFFDIKSFQIQVYGIVDGEEKLYAIYLDPNTTTIGEVKGSREDGFTVDVTVTITEDDAYEAGWIEKRDPDSTVADREYDWSRTPETITFTLEYTGDLTGNLYGDRSGDWVRTDNGKTYGAVGQAYLITAKPAAPEQKNVVEDLVTIICDSDPDRHAPVTGKWYPQHCNTTSDMVWNDELKAWTVDIRIGSLYIMYVNQLEDANNGTIHELVEDITTVYSTLKWDAEQGLWVPTQPIELHTTCRTAPVAPSYDQISGYQIKVYGDVDDDGVYGETKPSNNGIGEVYTTSIPENGYTLSEVYGSREEGFFVDVTVPIENGDAYITNWIANCEPGAEYLYDFEKTPATVTFTLRYNGSLTGTLHGDRHASNTNYDWVLDTTDLHYGVVGEGYVEQKTYAVQLVIYRNGNTTAPYDVIALENLPKGAVIDLSALDINDYYSSRLGFEFEGWFNDGAWNQYKAGKKVAGLEEITVNGWTNIICMVTDYQTVQIQIYRNGNTTDVYKTITLDKMLKGDVLDLTTLDINDYYSSTYGFVFEGWFNDGKWNQYKAGQDVTGMTEITINGWTNIICMVTDCQKVVVKAVVNGDKENAEVIFNGAAPKGVNLIEWLNENVEVPEKEGYTVDMWYNWDWYGHKFGKNAKVNGWTNVYVTYTANEYTVSYNTNGGPEVADKVVTFGAKYGIMPNSSITGLSSRKNDWYLVDENGNVTDINIRNTTVVSVARDHELFLIRDVLAPSVKIALTVPGGLSDSYKYYDGNARVLTATVSNMNAEVLDYTYQWYKDGVAIEGATESVLTLEGNVSDSGTYKVVVTATLKDGSEIVVKVDTASGEKSQKVQIMRAANTLRLNENYGETPVTSDSYWGSAVATIRGGATREGYTFAGWNTAADGSGETYQVGDEVAFPGDNGNGGVVLELFAQWNAITYTIKYNGGEGAQYVGSELNSGDNWMLIKNGYTYDQPVTLNDGADFVRPGYKLVGWTIGGQAYELGQTVEKNFTKVQSGTVQAYAIWEPITYRIKYAGGEGAEYVGDLPNSKNDWVIIAGYPYGEEITLHDGTGFQRTGYTLTGWTIKGKTYELGGTAEGSFTTVQSGMITAYAVWKANTYTLILDANGGEFVMPLAEESDAVTTLEIPVTFGQAIGELPTPVREGYTFAGWFDAEGNEITDETVYNTDGDLTVTAAWTPNTYEVKLDANGGKLEDDTIEVTYGEPVGELPTPTREGYTFAGWVDAEGNKVTADTIYDVADDTTLVATWNVNKPADPSSPPTGDGMTMFFMVSMLASAAALLFLADRKRRMA